METKENIVDQVSKKDLEEMFDKSLEKWMDKQFARFGRWSFYGLLAAAFASMVWFVVEVRLKGGP